MIFSCDHTYIRLAALTDSLINELLTDRYPGLTGQTGQPLSVDDVKEAETAFAVAVPGKEDLLTEWFLREIAKDMGSFNYLTESVTAATWYFTHYRTPLFREVVQWYSGRAGRPLNPKNIMDFSAYELFSIQSIYEDKEEEARQNKFPEELPDGVRLFYNDGNYQILEVTEIEAACALATGTRWCTRDEADAEKYLDEDPLYVIYRHHDRLAQLHIGRGWDEWTGIQLKNLRNRTMTPDEGLRKALVNSGLMKSILQTIAAAGGPEKNFNLFVGTQDNPMIRAFCAHDPTLAYFYAKNVIRGRFLEAERTIASEDLEIALSYVSDVIKGRFPEAEEEIIEQGYEHNYLRILGEVNPQQRDEFAEFLEEYEEREHPRWS